MTDAPPPAPSGVWLRPLATPLPLGFLALAVGSFVTAGVELSWVPSSEKAAAGLVLVALVAPLQALASVIGFLSRDPIAGTGVGILSGTWLTIGLVEVVPPSHSHTAVLGLLLVASAVALWIPVAAGGVSKVVASAVMVATSVRFFLTGAYELSGASAWRHAAGGWGLLLCVVAVYAALALEVEGTSHGTRLPTGRYGSGRGLFSNDYPDEVSQVHHEPGVRRTL